MLRYLQVQEACALPTQGQGQGRVGHLWAILLLVPGAPPSHKGWGLSRPGFSTQVQVREAIPVFKGGALLCFVLL